MSTLAPAATRISLETGCCDSDLARDLLSQLTFGRYGECSVLDVPASLDAWLAEHRTARKRFWRCLRRGYSFRQLQREHHSDEIHAINTSLGHRQGRPMSAGYLERTVYAPLPSYPCERHQVRTWGVWSPEDVLVAYIAMYRVGELALVSQILGHAHHLDGEVMWMLFAFALEREIPIGGFVVYNRHDSGTDGLRWWKERCGFEERVVEWQP